MIHVAVPLLVAGAMPFILTAVAKVGAFTPKDNHETRNWQAHLTGWRQRAHWAHQNSFEAFPLFAASLLAAQAAAPASHVIPAAAWGFVAARVAYAGCYLADVAALRSLVWFAGVACCAALLIAAV
ncbi:MAG: MAPEG family protein [Polyangiales bacterium]